MSTQIRRATHEDAEACGEICYRAFCGIADQHNFQHEFPSVEAARQMIRPMTSHPGFYGVVAEHEGRIVGSNFLDERSAIAGIPLISVDPEVQNKAIGRQLMQHMLDRAGSKGFPGVRLVQNAYHNRSFSLYAKLGFQIREPLSVMAGPPLGASSPGYAVRPATDADLKSCNALCFSAHGFDRSGALRDAIKDGMASVVEHRDRITGYATAIGYAGHTVGESNEELKALILAAPIFRGPGFLVPSRNGKLLEWCFSMGFRLMQQSTLMTVGLYNEPKSPYLPSITY